MSHINGLQFSPEQTLFIKAVPKGRVKMLEEAVVKYVDKDPLCPNAFLIYANYTSAGDARRGQDKLERWMDDKWCWPGRPSVQIKGSKAKAPELTFPPEQTLVLKPVLPSKKELLERAVVAESQPKNLHSVLDREESVPGALLMYANYASVDETWRAKQRLEAWLDSNWEWADRPVIAIKAAQQEVYFGIHVSGLPAGAEVGQVESFFSQFGTSPPPPPAPARGLMRTNACLVCNIVGDAPPVVLHTLLFALSPCCSSTFRWSLSVFPLTAPPALHGRMRGRLRACVMRACVMRACYRAPALLP